MYGIHYGTHRSIACIVLIRHGILKDDEKIGLLDAEPLHAGRLLEFYNAKKLVVYNTTVVSGQTMPWFLPSKVTRMLTEFDLGKMFDPNRDQGIGIHLASNRGTKYTLQEARDSDIKNDITAHTYIETFPRHKINRIS